MVGKGEEESWVVMGGGTTSLMSVLAEANSPSQWRQGMWLAPS